MIAAQRLSLAIRKHDRTPFPVPFEELVAITKADHPSNAAWRQVSTYWEMVYGIVKHGIVHPEYVMASNGVIHVIDTVIIPE